MKHAPLWLRGRGDVPPGAPSKYGPDSYYDWLFQSDGPNIAGKMSQIFPGCLRKIEKSTYWPKSLRGILLILSIYWDVSGIMNIVMEFPGFKNRIFSFLDRAEMIPTTLKYKFETNWPINGLARPSDLETNPPTVKEAPKLIAKIQWKLDAARP